MDTVLDKAVDLARDVAVEVAEDAVWVGEYLGVNDVADRLVTHQFACTMPGYRGWVWAVTLSRAPRGREAAVCEAHLVPADDALLAPAWIPWADRIRPGDLEPSMVLPKIVEDVRLEPGYELHGEDEDALEIWELGLGRERVLAPEGRNGAAERWYRGSHGPTASSAVASASPCSTCAFFIPLTGSLRTTFGACSNEWSPSDGKVVSVDHGCGAHSQTDIERQGTKWPDPDPVFDTDAVASLTLETPEDTVEEAAPDKDAAPEASADAAAPEPEGEAVLESEPTSVVTAEAEVAPEASAQGASAVEAPAEDAPAEESPAN